MAKHTVHSSAWHSKLTLRALKHHGVLRKPCSKVLSHLKVTGSTYFQRVSLETSGSPRDVSHAGIGLLSGERGREPIFCVLRVKLKLVENPGG